MRNVWFRAGLTMLFTVILMFVLGPSFPRLARARENSNSRPSSKSSEPVPRPLSGVHSPQDRPGEAQRYFLEKRVRKGQLLPIEKYEEARRELASMSVFSSVEGRMIAGKGLVERENDLAGVSSWTPLGPGNIGGRTRALVIDPADPLVLYAGAASGGVWKTVNGGVSWVPVGDGLPNLAVNALALDPTSPPSARVLYAGTGEGFLNLDAVRGAGIFKTTDGGKSWTRLPATSGPDFYFVNELAQSPVDAKTVYAATRTGVWKSIDGGTTWTAALKTDGSGGSKATIVRTSDDTGITDLAIRTDTSPGGDTLFASSGSFQSDGLYRTTDGGATWIRTLTAAEIGRTSAAVAPSRQNTVYALSAKTTGRVLNVFRSTDGGATWSPRIQGVFNPENPAWLLLSNPIFSNRTCGLTSGSVASQGWHDNAIAVSPTNSDMVFVGGIDLFRSDDGGETFGPISYWWIRPTSPEFVHADQHVLAFDPKWDGVSNQTLYVGNDGGVFKTANATAAAGSGDQGGVCYYPPSVPSKLIWKGLNNGYAVTQFYHGAVYPNGAAFIGGTQDNGVVRGLPDAPNDWETLLTGDGGFCAVDSRTSGKSTVLYTEQLALSLFKSTDNGFRFDRATTGINDYFGFIAPFAMDPKNPDRLWIGGYRPWRTTDGGANWTDARESDFSGHPVSAVAVAPSDGATVYMGTVAGEVFRTANGLDDVPTWTKSEKLPPAWCGGLTVDPADAKTAYATFSTFGFGHVWKTTDGGVNWINLDGTGGDRIPDVPVHCLAVHPTARNVLYVGTDLGVLGSTDGGQSWRVENTGFAAAVVEALVWETTVQPGVSPNPPVLYAFTHGRGVFRAEISINPPRPPSPLVVTLSSPTQATLVWSRNNSDETGFSVERKDGPNGKYRVVVTLPARVTTATDSNLLEGRQYFYRARVLGAGGASVYSNEAQIATPGIAPPSDLRARPVSKVETFLTWTDNSFNEGGFLIERKTGANGTYASLTALTANKTSFTDTRVTPGQVYFYRVLAAGVDGFSAYSNEDSPTPATPTNLISRKTTFSTVELVWADNSTNEIAYIIERKLGAGEDEGFWARLTTVAADSTGFLNLAAGPETVYAYRVKAVNEVLESAYSNVLVVRTPAVPSIPEAPTDLIVKSVSTASAMLVWRDQSANEEEFILERKTGETANFVRVASLPPDTTQYADEKLTAGTSYAYRVRAVNGGGPSGYSNEVRAVTEGVAPPSKLSGTALSSSEIELVWLDNSFNEVGFVIERKAPDEPAFRPSASAPANVTRFRDTGLAPKTNYMYRVRATGTNLQSVDSGEIQVRTLQPAPIVTGVSPRKGRPGTLVTMTGNDFEAASVTFGAALIGFSSPAPGKIQFVVPSVPRGPVVVTIKTPGGATVTNFMVK